MSYEIEWNTTDGRPEDAIDAIHRKICGYRRFGIVYIGATQKLPDARADEHVDNGREVAKVVVLYEAYTYENAVWMETELIDRSAAAGFRLPIDNDARGGGGLIPGARRYYVYALVRPRPKVRVAARRKAAAAR
jgi:hypothetical protein